MGKKINDIKDLHHDCKSTCSGCQDRYKRVVTVIESSCHGLVESICLELKWDMQTIQNDKIGLPGQILVITKDGFKWKDEKTIQV